MSGETPATPRYFRSAASFRRWLAQHHDKARELWVGLYKKESGKGGLTYPESVDQALCYGWIDGIRKSVDGSSYTQRFTPRKATSIWSAINRRRVRELEARGLMAAPGLAAFRGRDKRKQQLYSFENRHRGMERKHRKAFEANRQAWAYFKGQPAWYQRTSSWWVISAKRDETRSRRLATLIEMSERKKWIPQLTRTGKVGGGR